METAKESGVSPFPAPPRFKPLSCMEAENNNDLDRIRALIMADIDSGYLLIRFLFAGLSLV